MILKGRFTPAGDKSISHRMALMSLISKGTVEITNFSPCEDCTSSLNAVKSLGVGVRRDWDVIHLTGAGGVIAEKGDIDCGNSGTTIRLITGLLAGRKGMYSLDGDRYLRRRPMERVARPMRMMGAEVNTTDGRCPLTVKGGSLAGIDYTLPVASAQLKSAVLFAGLQADGVTSVSEPALSRDHTERMIAGFGGTIRTVGNKISVEQSCLVFPEKFRVPGDASSAAFFLCAAAVLPESDVTAEGMLLNETRTGFIDVLKRMGADITIDVKDDNPEKQGSVTARYASGLKGCDVRPEEIPLLVDEVPILALVATQAEGRTVFNDVGELRVKETDRLAAVASELNKMGANISIESDGEKERLVIEGKTPLKAPLGLDSYGDHRMAMTLRLALVIAGGDCVIADEACTGVSYPAFQDDLTRLLR